MLRKISQEQATIHLARGRDCEYHPNPSHPGEPPTCRAEQHPAAGPIEPDVLNDAGEVPSRPALGKGAAEFFSGEARVRREGDESITTNRFDTGRGEQEHYNGLASIELPHGKYKGAVLDDVPLAHLEWLIRHGSLKGRLARDIRDYLRIPSVAAQLQRERKKA